MELSRQELKNQIVFQNSLYRNLIKWLSAAMVLSSLFFSAAILIEHHPIIHITAIICTIVCILAMLVIGLAIKNSHSNLKKLLNLLDQNI